MNIEYLYGKPDDSDNSLTWRLNEDRDEYVFNELISRMKLSQRAVAAALKGKLSTCTVIGSAGTMQPISRKDAEAVSSFLRVTVETLFITKGECRQNARDCPVGEIIGGERLLTNSGGCIRLG